MFCGLNAAYKIDHREFAIWMALLRSAPGSVLWLLDANATARVNLSRAAAAGGVDPARIVICPRLAHDAHMDRRAQADLALDTFFYNAHATGSDALWAGVPMVTRLGQQFAARVGASLVAVAGLPEIIATTDAEYYAIAHRFMHDAAFRTDVRTRLATSRETAPLFDTARHTRALEEAFTPLLADR